MKNYIFTAIAFLALSACSAGDPPLNQKQQALIQTEIKDVFDELSQAAQTLDHERYLSYFDQDQFSILNADGTTLNNFEDFKDVYLPQLDYIQAYNELQFDPVYITVIDSRNAILVNEYTAEVLLKSGDIIAASGAGAQLWSKRSGDWKLVHISDAAK